jgi:hypothetical protein
LLRLPAPRVVALLRVDRGLREAIDTEVKEAAREEAPAALPQNVRR